MIHKWSRQDAEPLGAGFIDFPVEMIVIEF